MSAKTNPRSINRAKWLLMTMVWLLTACATRLDYEKVRQIHPPEQPWPDSVFFDTGNTRVHGRLARSSQPAKGYILLLHGLAGSTWSWQAISPQLQAAGYTVLALDIPPFGFSANSSADFRDSRSAVAALTGIMAGIHDGSWIVGGHSMGARYATRLALSEPDRVAALVLFDAAVLPEERRPPGRLAAWFIRPFLNYTLRRPAQLRRFLKGAYGQKPDDAAVFAYAAPFSQPGKIAALTAWALQAPAEDPLALDALALPVLLVWGEKDTWVPIENAHTIKQAVPQATLAVIGGAGHNPMETHPAESMEAVSRFLDRLEATK